LVTAFGSDKGGAHGRTTFAAAPAGANLCAMKTGSGAPNRASRRGRIHPRLLRTLLSCVLAATAVSGCWLFPGPTPSSEPTFEFVVDPEVVFSPTTLADAQVDKPYSVTITVGETRTPVGGASIQTGALPDGLALILGDNHDNTMQITGMPTTAGTYQFTVYVWCYGTNVSGQTGAQRYTLVVK
jgi:hypothetical protein